MVRPCFCDGLRGPERVTPYLLRDIPESSFERKETEFA